MSKRIVFLNLVTLIATGALIAGCSGRGPGHEPSASTPSSQPAASISATPLISEDPTPVTEGSQTEPTKAFVPISRNAVDCAYGGEFKSIQALNEKTVRFELCYPDVAFLSKIAFPSFGILPSEFLESTGGGGKDSLLLTAPVGSGPYQVESWTPGQELSLSAYPGYWDLDADSVQKLIFRWNLDDSQRLLELQTGTVDGIDEPNPMDFESIKADSNLVWVSRAPLSVSFIGMNNTYPPFDNQLVRQAISMALDRQEILETLFPIGFQRADFFTPCVIPNGCVGEPWYEYDPVKARELLTEAGIPDGFETQISYRSVVRGYLPEPALVAESIRAQLQKNLNITAKPIAIDSPQFLQAAEDGLLPGLFLMGWGADYPDVTNFLDTHFGAESTKMFGNPFDDILVPLDQGNSVAGDEARRPYYETANNAIRQHLPVIPLTHGGWVKPNSLALAFRQKVEKAYADPFGFERFAEFALDGQPAMTFMQRYEPLSLYCADETDTGSLRACSQVIEPLYRFQMGSSIVEPALAESCEPNPELTSWTCSLRQGVSFHDGSILDANDVAVSMIAQWDAADPLHKGRTGNFAYFKSFWGNFLNAPLN